MSKPKKKKQTKKQFKQQKKKQSTKGLLNNQKLWLGALLFVVLLAYLPILQGEFINYDDDIYITENTLIRNFDGAKLSTLFSDYYYNQYSPVAMLIMALEFKAFGANPAILKFISILLHLISMLLTFQLIRELFNRADYALITAGLFGIHTLQVESVAWLTASMKIGAFSVFSLGALLVYTQYLKKKNASLYFLSIGLFLLSCFSKEQALATAVVLVAIDYLKNRPLLSRQVIFEKLPFFVIALIFGLVTLGVSSEMQNEKMVGYFSFFQRLIFACYAMAFYLFKLILPIDLSAFYTYPFRNAIPVYYYLSPILSAGVLYALYYFWKKDNKVIVFGILFFLINVSLPMMSQIMSVRETMMADRYVYLPAIGFFLILAYLLTNIMKKKPKLRNNIWGGLMIYGLFLAVLTSQRAPVWNDSIKFFTDVLEKAKTQEEKINPFLGLAYNNRGIAYKNTNQLDKAMADYNRAISLDSADDKAFTNRANLYFQNGQHNEAIADYKKALELNFENALTHSGLGAVYATQNRLEASLEEFNEAIRIKPDFADAYRNRALSYYYLRKYPKAKADLDQYLVYNPGDTEMNNLRTNIINEMNR